MPSLKALVKSLGIAEFEADYIRTEAERLAAPSEGATYNHAIQALQRDHAARIEGLRNLTDVEPDVRDQLVEAEETRFRQALLDVGTNGRAAASGA